VRFWDGVVSQREETERRDKENDVESIDRCHRVFFSSSLTPPPLRLRLHTNPPSHQLRITNTNSDPVEAYLADGACVAAWCRASLASTRALVEGAAAASASAPSEALAAAEGLATARTRLAALVPLSEALSRGGGGGSDEAAAAASAGDDDDEMNGEGLPPAHAPSSSSSEEARKLAQCADVLDWCLAEGSAADSLRGRYASEAEWRVAVSRRRAAVSGGVGGSGGSGSGVKISSTFLDALRARAAAGSPSLSTSSTSTVEYPPASTPRAAAPAIFLSGGASPSALSAKLDLFAYCLADAGEELIFFEDLRVSFQGPTKKNIQPSNLPFFRLSPPTTTKKKSGGAASLPSLGARFGSSSAAVARWRLSQLLDDALANIGDPSSDDSFSLDAAVRAVPVAASPDAPYELGKALVALGRPEAALALLRARTKSSFSSSSSRDSSSDFETRLDEALTGLSARLECGLLSEAFTESRAAAARAAPVGSREHAVAVGRLAVALARWAADNGELPSVALFPLSSLEENALLQWIGSEEANRDDAVLQTVLFHLQRGRAPEALLAAAKAEGGRLVKPSSAAAAAAGGRGGALVAAEAGALELLRQAARSLPAAQRALLLLAPGGGSSGGAPLPSLRLAGPGEPAPEGSLRLVGEGLADLPAARLLSERSRGGGGAQGAPLLLSLTSEAWMEKRAAGGGAAAAAAEEEEGEEEGGLRKTLQKPSALRPPPRTRATSNAAASPGWDWKAGGGGGGGASAAAPASGFLAPVGTATAKKKARLQAVRL